MADRLGGFFDSWPAYAFAAVAFGVWGVSKLIGGAEGTDTFFGVVLLVIAAGNAARSVVAARRSRI